MFRIDVYAKNPKKPFSNKKVASHWYPTIEDAFAAKNAIIHLSKNIKKKTFVPGENRKEKTLTFGPWTVSSPVEDNKY